MTGGGVNHHVRWAGSGGRTGHWLGLPGPGVVARLLQMAVIRAREGSSPGSIKAGGSAAQEPGHITEGRGLMGGVWQLLQAGNSGHKVSGVYGKVLIVEAHAAYILRSARAHPGSRGERILGRMARQRKLVPSWVAGTLAGNADQVMGHLESHGGNELLLPHVGSTAVMAPRVWIDPKAPGNGLKLRDLHLVDSPWSHGGRVGNGDVQAEMESGLPKACHRAYCADHL